MYNGKKIDCERFIVKTRIISLNFSTISPYFLSQLWSRETCLMSGQLKRRD